MGNNDEFKKFLMEHEDEEQTDVILRKMLDSINGEDSELSDKAYHTFAQRTGIERRKKMRQWSTVLMRVAAAISVPLLLLSVWALHKAAVADVQWLQESTAVAQTRDIELADGSVVRLQPCSTIYYPEKFVGQERKVMLSGEAFLEVAKDARKKFVVGVGNMDITVHGTRFKVSSFPGDEEDEVALLEGSVEISLRGKHGSVFLVPGEMVKYDKTEGTLFRRSFAINYYENVLSAGGLHFDNERLSDIAAALNRHFDANIVVQDSSLASERYLASFINGEDLDDILAALNTGGQFRISKKDKYIYLTK